MGVDSSMKDKRRLEVLGNMLLKITYDTAREEVTGGWRKLHNEELHDVYSSSNVITVMGIDSAHERDEKRLHSYGRKN
jgi:hypothetical protein